MPAFRPPFSPEDLNNFHRVLAHSLDVRNHFDVLIWLQGEMQLYLPHDILIAAWGDFSNGEIRHDIISSIEGVRSYNASSITPLLRNLFTRWVNSGKKPLSYNDRDNGLLLRDTGLQCAVGVALQQMHSAMVHGIIDERGSHDCLYVTFSTKDITTDLERAALGMVLPYIDLALRQIEHLPHQEHPYEIDKIPDMLRLMQAHDLSEREFEILQWVTMGKTNPEIGLILDISEFTVKNHLQRVFKKLNVSNRAQAVGKIQALSSNV